MSDRKEIIINEIKYWKSHKLLPEHFCDFLLTLYTEGSMEEEPKKRSFNKKLAYYFFIYFLASQIPITFIVIYFTELSFVLQMLLVLFFIITSLGVTIFLMKKRNNLYHLSIISGVLVLLLSSVSFVSKSQYSSNISLFSTIFINCALWVIIGYQLKLKYLMIAGATGAVLTVIYMII